MGICNEENKKRFYVGNPFFWGRGSKFGFATRCPSFTHTKLMSVCVRPALRPPVSYHTCGNITSSRPEPHTDPAPLHTVRGGGGGGRGGMGEGKEFHPQNKAFGIKRLLLIVVNKTFGPHSYRPKKKKKNGPGRAHETLMILGGNIVIRT